MRIDIAVLPLAMLLADCAYLGCPSGQELSKTSCVCSSTLEPPVDGMCIDDGCGPDGCPCTLEGIEAAIARGGTQVLKCDANAPPVSTTETIVIDNDVTLDGQSNCGPDEDQPCLTVQGDERHLVFDIQPFEVELIGFTITRGDQAIHVSADATLTLRNSVVEGNTSFSSGGGGVLNEGVLTLVDTTVQGNTATIGSGGGIHNTRTGMLTLANSEVSNNVSEVGPGGGIRNDEGTVVITGSEVSGNDAQAEDGGGISNEDGTVTVTDSLIQGNTAGGFGGGLSNEGFSATMRITDSTVSGNNSARPGGGIRSQHGELVAMRTTWTGNQTSFDGGGILVEGDDSVGTIASSTVSANSATGVGGGIRVFENARVTIVNSTIYENSAGDGGALHIDFGGQVEVRSSTISNNDVVGKLGVPISERESASIVNLNGTLTLIQTLIDDTCVVLSTTTSLGHNIESPADTCLLDGTNDMVDVTPEALNLAEQLEDNGGATLTLLLTRPSVAVDYLISTCDQAQDQRGKPRPGGLECDIGAVELE